jgi:alanine or glycine:cation symporter, AGCS family
MSQSLPLRLASALLLGLLAPLPAALAAGPSPARTQQSPPAEVAQDAPAPEAPAETAAAKNDWQAQINEVMRGVNNAVAGVIFADVWFFDNKEVTDAAGKTSKDNGIVLPFAVFWLALGAAFFTLRMGFINLRGFRHAIDVVRGKYTDPNNQGTGDVSHFQALAAALSATVGLGNIAGVAIAVAIGGPGATFWMILAGLLGMTSKFTECSLGQKYRKVRPDGTVMGGAMYYLSDGLKRRGLGGLGMVLAVTFAILCVGGSIAGGNSYQVNQSMGAVASVKGLEFLAPASPTNPGGGMGWIYGAVMTFLTGIVILGGIKRIAQVAEKIVPFMCGTYILACLYILFSHSSEVPAALMKIITEAFDPQTVLNPDALKGGFIGVLVVGFKRAAFSNEAGVGSAAIAHSAAKTDYPVREGIVALLEPFIDTVVVCTMTALVIVITGAYNNPEYATIIADNQGAQLTSKAFGERISWFPYVLAMATALFAYSTMISWSYYGERCWVWLFGEKWSLAYKILFLAFTFLGSVITATQLLDFGDLMILGMALPNILGVLILSGEVKKDLADYWKKFKAGEFKRYS